MSPRLENTINIVLCCSRCKRGRQYFNIDLKETSESSDEVGTALHTSTKYNSNP